MVDGLNKEEKSAIASLKRLAKRWPNTLWLFSASGTLHVMKKNSGGDKASLDSDGFDPNYAVDNIDIENDGGDW